jgi:hypothetical protein
MEDRAVSTECCEAIALLLDPSLRSDMVDYGYKVDDNSPRRGWSSHNGREGVTTRPIVVDDNDYRLYAQLTRLALLIYQIAVNQNKTIFHPSPKLLEILTN